MRTKIVGPKNLPLSYLTRYGRNRNEIVSKMRDEGCKIIKECKEGCGSRVYLGYKNEYVSFANVAARVCRNGAITYKKSDSVHSPIPSSLRTFTSYKYHIDKEGDIEISTSKRKFQDGKILEWFDVTRKYVDI